MRPRFIALSLTVLLVAAVAPTAGAASQPRRIKAPWAGGRHAQRFVGGEVLVRFERGVNPSDRRAAHRSLGGRVLQELLLPDTYLVELPRGLGVRDAVRRYQSLDAVSYATPNFKRYLMATPNDTRFAEMWGLNNTGQTAPASGLPVPGADIDATAAWDGPTGFPGMGTGTASTVVAVIDDGVSINHSDLDGNIFQNTADPLGGGDQDGNKLVDDTNGWDFIDSDRNVIGADTHGTHVAGTIGAEGNNNHGVTGVSWDVSLLPVRIFRGNDSSLAAVINAYVYSGRMGADVANGSFGGAGKSQLEIDALRASKNTLFVVASGNGGFDGIGDNNDNTPMFPCNYDEPNVMCVGATDPADRLTSFSNFGDESVHIVAPGEAILSTSRHAFAAQHDFEVTPPPNWTRTGSWNSGAGGFVGHGMSLQDSPGGANYADNQSSTATLPIDLSDLTDCALEYITFFELENAFDFVHVESSGDGTTWTTHRSYTGTDIGFDEIDLQAREGDGTAFLRFRLQSDGDINDDGIYVDDLAVRCNSATGSDGGYQFLQGTSMATPHVAGTAALIFQTQPNANPFSVRRALMASADPLPLPADVARLFPGSGRLNADAFLDEDATPLGVPTVTSPTLSQVFQKKASVSVSSSTPGASGYRIRVDRTRYNSLRSSRSFLSSTGKKTVSLPAGSTYCISSNSIEPIGNESNFSTRRCTAVPVNNTSLKHSRGWSKRSVSGSFLNTFSQSKKRGASLSLSGVFFDRIALVATKCRGCGKVGLYFGNQKAPFKKISLSSTRTKKLQTITAFNKSGGPFKSKIIIKVLTSGRLVKIEGLGVFLKPSI